ncbi:MAG: hypothetical protein ACK56F_19430, partial [bacterium]
MMTASGCIDRLMPGQDGGRAYGPCRPCADRQPPDRADACRVAGARARAAQGPLAPLSQRRPRGVDAAGHRPGPRPGRTGGSAG